MILQLLSSLPTSFDNVYDTYSATGAAINAAKKMVVSSTVHFKGDRFTFTFF